MKRNPILEPATDVGLMLRRRSENEAVGVDELLMFGRQPGDSKSDVPSSVLGKISGAEKRVNGGSGHPRKTGGGENGYVLALPFPHLIMTGFVEDSNW